MTVAAGGACLWRRLDGPGHDACRYGRDGLGWLIEGSAVFADGGRVHALDYRLRCDDRWASQSAIVEGWIGDAAFTVEIDRTQGGGWSVDGREIPELAGLSDIDLGFTPATNTPAVRRLDLAVGEKAELVAVWLDTEDWTVKPLAQSYRRAAPLAYEYASPQHDFRARLSVDLFGAVVDYPALWRREEVGITAAA